MKHSIDRLGTAVYPVARRFFKSLEGRADRGRRVLSGLSRREGAIYSPSDRKIVEVGRIFRLSGPAMGSAADFVAAVLPAYVVALRRGA